jgi:membrane protease YdiL (CAAX protease family)
MEPDKSKQYKPWLFFALTYGWSWIILIPAVAARLSVDQPVTNFLRVLSGIGPALSALLLLYTTCSVQCRREYWQRLTSFRRIKPHWLIVSLFTPLALTLLSGVLDALLGGKGLQLESGLPEVTSPLAWIGFVAFILIFGPVPEEMGWRGYALDGLQGRRSALFSSLVLGLVWALWHLPLFFIEGTYQANLGILTDDFWIFILMMIPESVLITWAYNNTRRSTLSAVLFHFSINLTGEIFFASPTGTWINFGLWILAAGLIVFVTDPMTFQAKILEKRDANPHQD